MNKINQKVRTRFAPAVRFKVEPAPFRATETSQLDVLKDRLLLQLLQDVSDPVQNALLRRAANEAAALAWFTQCPLLLFPGLFEEKARTALAQGKRQASVRKRSMKLLTEAA